MVLSSALEKASDVPKNEFSIFLRLLNPFAPHLVSEIVSKTFPRKKDEEERSWMDRIEAFLNVWPISEQDLRTEASVVKYIIQVNGTKRAEMLMPGDADEDAVVSAAKAQPNAAKYLSQGWKRVIFVPGKLVNFVV
jgi:leucyl-tRNA synthetase